MANNSAGLGLSTKSVHAGTKPGPAGSPVVQPLYQSANYVQDVGVGEGLKYIRDGNVPNAELAQTRIAMLEGAEAGIVLSSGMGATACAIMAIVRPGDHILSSSWVYGGTYELFTKELATLGVTTTFVDPTAPHEWQDAVKPETRVFFVESPANPTVRVVDLAPLSVLAKQHNARLLVDSTFASPINFRPLEHGADAVIHSATKYLNGHHDILCGAVAGDAKYIEIVRQKMHVWGQAPDPFSCWLLERGLKTLAVRVRQQNTNALRIAMYCNEHPSVRRVHYPGLPNHPDHEIAKRVLDGYGGMLAIELRGGIEAADGFLRRLTLFTHAASLGGVDSLVIEPRISSHRSLTPDERAAAGIPDGFIRVSVGIEDSDDLIEDIRQALA